MISIIYFKRNYGQIYIKAPSHMNISNDTFVKSKLDWSSNIDLNQLKFRNLLILPHHLTSKYRI